MPQDIQPSPLQRVILVHGALTNNQQPSKVYIRRLERAAELHGQNPDARILVSGKWSPRALPTGVKEIAHHALDNGQQLPPDLAQVYQAKTEAAVGAAYLEKLGIESDKILQERNSFCIFSNMVLSVRMLASEPQNLAGLHLTSVGPDWLENRLLALSGWLRDVYQVGAWDVSVVPDVLAFAGSAEKETLLAQEANRIWERILPQMQALERFCEKHPQQNKAVLFECLFREFHPDLACMLNGTPAEALAAERRLYADHRYCQEQGYARTEPETDEDLAVA